MDEPFFRRAMKAVGIPVYTIDENTVFKEAPMPDDIQILSKNYYKARENTPCDWADDNHLIKAGRRYVRVVVKPDGAPLQTQKVCLDCWMKP